MKKMKNFFVGVEIMTYSVFVLVVLQSLCASERTLLYKILSDFRSSKFYWITSIILLLVSFFCKVKLKNKKKWFRLFTYIYVCIRTCFLLYCFNLFCNTEINALGYLSKVLVSVKVFLEDTLLLSYIFIVFISGMQLLRAILFHLRFGKQDIAFMEYDRLRANKQPPIAVIVPAYNEEDCIERTVNSILGSDYPMDKLQIIVVSDGSTDSTSQIMRNTYLMEKSSTLTPRRDKVLTTTKVLGIYTSKKFPNLHFIEKVNGGKHDSLNCAINYIDECIEWFLAIDADGRLDPESIDKMSLETTKYGDELVALTGTVLSDNLNYPLAKIQQIEYANSFFIGRSALSYINNMMIVSGAFGLFRIKKVLELNGYQKSLGEDMILTLSLQKDKSNVIAYLPEVFVYTQMPFRMEDLKKQRKRWHKGLIESLISFKNYAVNLKMAVGYWEFLLVELLNPLLIPFGMLFTVFSSNFFQHRYLISTSCLLVISMLRNMLSLYYLKKYNKEQHVSIFYSIFQFPVFLFTTVWRDLAILDYRRKSWDHLSRVKVED